MTDQDAMAALAEGKKVRLSDWTGYWFMDNTGDSLKIMVLTRDGDILDSPNVFRYNNRDDWEIVENEGFGFDFAIRAMKNGKKVTQLSANWAYHFIRDDEDFWWCDTRKGSITEWYPEPCELLANDWVLFT